MIKRTSVNLDRDLVRKAREILGTKGTTDTLHRALAEVIRREQRRRLAEWTFGDLDDVALEELRKPRTADDSR